VVGGGVVRARGSRRPAAEPRERPRSRGAGLRTSAADPPVESARDRSVDRVRWAIGPAVAASDCWSASDGCLRFLQRGEPSTSSSASLDEGSSSSCGGPQRRRQVGRVAHRHHCADACRDRGGRGPGTRARDTGRKGDAGGRKDLVLLGVGVIVLHLGAHHWLGSLQICGGPQRRCQGRARSSPTPLRGRMPARGGRGPGKRGT
jgi:hypothetical protein